MPGNEAPPLLGSWAAAGHVPAVGPWREGALRPSCAPWGSGEDPWVRAPSASYPGVMQVVLLVLRDSFFMAIFFFPSLFISSNVLTSAGPASNRLNSELLLLPRSGEGRPSRAGAQVQVPGGLADAGSAPRL